MHTDKHIKQTCSAILSRIFVCLLVSDGAIAKPDIDAIEQSVVRVVVFASGGVGTGSGFVINDQGVVVTNHHVVDVGTRFEVYPSGSSTGLAARLLHVDEQRDLAILRVPGLSARGLRWSAAEIKKADSVWSVGFPGLADRLGTAFEASWSDGVVSRIFPGSWGGSASFNIIQHTAAINPGNSGGPLFDDCGRVVGVNTQGSAAGRVIRDESGNIQDIMAGTGVFFASHSSAAMGFLRSEGINFTTDTEPCVAAQASAASKNSIIWAAALVMLGIVSILLVLRKPRQRVVRVVEHYTGKAAATIGIKTGRSVGIKTGRSVPGLVLSGFDSEGKPIRVIIQGKRIGEGYGATVGRHPGITVATIKDPSVSRRQFRVSYANQTHYIEDLNSSNGTRVNKVCLKPFTKTPVNPGDTIVVGSLEFTLSRHQ